MLFNSYEYILVFLPVTVVVFLALGRNSRSLALGWLILASVVFYAWWRPVNVAIIAPSIALNYVLGRALLGLAGDPARARRRTALLVLGIVFNVCFLGYFKYANFAVTVYDDVTGADFVLKHVILPLGISFITFQKIAFLIDVAGGRIKAFSLRDYLLFVMFFPQLIAGPIIHFTETMPQWAARHLPLRQDALRRRHHPLLLRALQEGGARRRHGRARHPGLRLRRHRRRGDLPAVVAGRGRLHPADLLRLLGLFRHGLRGGAALRHPPADQLRLAPEGDEHRRLLAALAHHPHPLPHRLRLQPDGADPHPGAGGEAPADAARPGLAPARLPARPRLPDAHHHGALRHLARGGLHLRPLGPAARALPRGEPPLAPVRAAAGADGRRRRAAGRRRSSPASR